jgi:hypothetical protein
MTDLAQELMTPDEAARWFRRSPSWLRQQNDLLRFGGPGAQPLYHIRVCRAWVLGRLQGLIGEALRSVQLQALAAACGVTLELQQRADPASLETASAPT